MHFFKIENFAYGKNNERSFSNPHPWATDDNVRSPGISDHGTVLQGHLGLSMRGLKLESEKWNAP